MYNGVGLQTARGSGTSGYVQKNLSHVVPGSTAHLKQDYGQILRQMKENPLALPKPPNQELLQHEEKRKIEAKVFSFKKGLPAGLSVEEIAEKVKEFRAELALEKVELHRREQLTTHEEAKLKQEQMARLDKAFKLSKDY